jgi:hypothetical protein
MAARSKKECYLADHLESPGESLSPQPLGVSQEDIIQDQPWIRSYNPRYPRWLVGRRLLWTTSLFGSLGDALFGFDQGMS